ncbi:MAG: phage baseplate protein [Chloroflexi bacterium]|nr:phage baseplate protein [Chloroflexota bacterium]
MSLSAAELLNAWEIGLHQPPLLRALTLLLAAQPDRSFDDLARLSLGQRNGALLDLREALFGAQLESVAACPQCGESLSLEFATSDLQTTTAPPPETLALEDETAAITFRVPNTLDLIAAAQRNDVAAAREVLLQQCVNQPIEPLSDQTRDAIAQVMAQADPQADLQLTLTCPACAHAWQVAFDIAAYLWSEINTWANRLLGEVHQLASAYGWREADILAMSAYRRECYLELTGA